MKSLAIDRSGSMELQANVMLKVLECMLDRKPVEVRVFDTGGKVKRYFCTVGYSDMPEHVVPSVVTYVAET